MRYALALILGLALGAAFGWALGISVAQQPAPVDHRTAQLEAECRYVADAGRRSFDAATAMLWRLYGPTGIPMNLSREN